jgi:hypothetical protein
MSYFVDPVDVLNDFLYQIGGSRLHAKHKLSTPPVLKYKAFKGLKFVPKYKAS